MPATPTNARRWRQPVLGVAVGALAAVLVFFALGLLRSDPVGEIVTAYRISDEDALAPDPVSLVSVRDVRQPSSVPGVAAPTGDRYVTVVVALDSDDEDARDDWIDLEGLRLTVHAVDGSGDRAELVPTDRAQRTLDGIVGQVRGRDPYWIRRAYEPPSGGVEHFEVHLHVDGEDHTFIAGPVEES